MGLYQYSRGVTYAEVRSREVKVRTRHTALLPTGEIAS